MLMLLLLMLQLRILGRVPALVVDGGTVSFSIAVKLGVVGAQEQG